MEDNPQSPSAQLPSANPLALSSQHLASCGKHTGDAFSPGKIRLQDLENKGNEIDKYWAQGGCGLGAHMAEYICKPRGSNSMFRALLVDEKTASGLQYLPALT